MDDDDIEVVQVKMSASHPKADICDLFARQDAYGLGPGLYPKGKAPKPPFHPFCRCVWLTSTKRAKGAVFRPGAHRIFLRQVRAEGGTSAAARIVGSRAKLAVALTQPLDAVFNIHRPPPYRLGRLGETAILRPKQGDAFNAAKTGGKHHGWYLNQIERSDAEIENGIRSFKRQIDRHSGWIIDPVSKVTGFRDLRPEHQTALIAGWRQGMERHEACIDILQGILKERENG